jgi:hypothetical protein
LVSTYPTKGSARFLANRNSVRTAEIVVYSGCPRSLSGPARPGLDANSGDFPEMAAVG